jgi:hypothetical protein
MDHTACGIPIMGPFASREWSREENHLCDRCWTRHEVDTGEMKRFDRIDLESEAARSHEMPTARSYLDLDDEEEDTDPNVS